MVASTFHVSLNKMRKKRDVSTERPVAASFLSPLCSKRFIRPQGRARHLRPFNDGHERPSTHKSCSNWGLTPTGSSVRHDLRYLISCRTPFLVINHFTSPLEMWVQRPHRYVSLHRENNSLWAGFITALHYSLKISNCKHSVLSNELWKYVTTQLVRVK